MRKLAYAFTLFGIIIFMAPCALPKPAPAPGDDTGSIVLVFKNGHRQSFAVADIERIEFNAPATSASLTERGRFVGEWKVGDGAGGTFLITLERDGDAAKTIGSKHGTWTVVNGEARISWEDGWHDVIRREGGKYHKVAFAPGKSFSDDPANIEDATPMVPN
jgi:hypothetical protein